MAARRDGEKSFQEMSNDQHKHLVSLTRAGVFQGQPAAWMTAMYLAVNLSARERDYAEVMPNCITTSAIMSATGLSSASVKRAISWLREQGIVRVRYEYQGERQRRVSVAFSSTDVESEDARREWLARKQPKRTKPEPVRRLKLVANDE